MRRAQSLTLLPVLGALAASGLAQQSILPYLPEGTMLAISVPDLDASIGEFSAMPLAKMWHEKEVQDFVQDAKDMAAMQIKKGMEQLKQMHAAGQLPVDPSQLMDLRVNGMSFAVTKLGLETGDFGPMPEIGMILQLDFGASSKQWFELLEMGMGMLAQSAKMTREDGKIGESSLVSLTPKKAPSGLKMALNVAMVGNSLILGTLRDEVTATVEHMQKGEKVLAATARYKSNAKHLTVDGAETEAFLRLDPIIDFLIGVGTMAAEHEPDMEWFDGEGMKRAVDALGLTGIQSIASTSIYKDGKAISTTFIDAPAPGRKGFLAGANKNLDMGFLKWVPKDAVGFSAGSFEPMSIYDALVGALNAYDPKMAEMALGHLAQMEQGLGVNLRDDLFGAIGDTFVTWSMPMASFATPPEAAMLVKVNDQEKVVKVLRKIAEMSQGAVELDEAEKRGVKTYQFRINMDPMGGMGGGMNPLDVLNPSFAFRDGWLVAGFSPSDIRQVFKRMDRTDDDPKSDIRGNKEFAAYLGTLPKDLQGVSFTDWKAQFESYYQILSSLLAFLPQNEDIPFDMSMLPDASTLTKHMFGSLTYSTADGSGMQSTTISPFGPEVGVLFVALVAAGAGFALTMRGM